MGGEHAGYELSRLQQMRNSLLQAIAAVFEESMVVPNSTAPRACEFHQGLVKSMRPADTILTYNYDCLIDHTLKANGNDKWSPRYGYGFNLGGHGANLVGDGFWNPQSPAKKNKSMLVLKLHGSLHFKVSDPESSQPRITLKERPYTRQHGNLKFTILAPEWAKPYDRGIFRQIWRLAGKAIHGAKNLVFIGYSIPTSDLHAASLFRVNLRKNSLRSLVIVNPDRGARYRTREVLRKGITPETRILVFDALKEFLDVDRSLWDSG